MDFLITDSGGTSSGGAGGASGGASGSGGSEPNGGAGTGGADEPPTLLVPVNAWQPSDACKTKAAEILAGLSISQKVAQMIQGETVTTTPDDVTSYQLGAVFGGGSADPSNNSASAWADMGRQSAARAGSDTPTDDTAARVRDWPGRPGYPEGVPRGYPWREAEHAIAWRSS